MPTVTEPVFDIRTGEQTGTVTVTVESSAETQARVAAEALAVTNEATIAQQLDAALAYNTQVQQQGTAWVQNNGGTLTASTLSNQVRALTTAAVEAAKQRNKLIRYLRRNFAGVD